MMIEARELGQTYQSGGRPLHVLRDINLQIAEREIIAFVGPSGSGKTTLLGLLAGLDVPTAGCVVLDGQNQAELSADDRATFRAQSVGFVFQSFHLIPTLTALENVMVPLELLSRGGAEAEGRASDLLKRVGLGDRTDHYPAQLSGGEQQRVALARAFANRPRLLFADEPTGNLDGDTGHQVIELLFELNREAGTTLVLVTHDNELASRSKRVVHLADGRIASDSGSARA